MATGWDWRAGVWSAIELVIAGAIYYPFSRWLKNKWLPKKQVRLKLS